MPSLEQLPEAAAIQGTDLILLDQSGVAKSASIDLMQAGLQPKLTLSSGVLLGRASPLPGQPEPIGVGSGLAMSAGSLVADTSVMAALASPSLTGTPTAPTPPSGDASTRLATTAFVQAKVAVPVTLGGDIIGAGPTANGVLMTTLPAITTPGTFSSVTVNQKGQVTAGVAMPSGTSVEIQSNKGVAGGYAGLDSTGKVPASQLPSTTGAVTSVAGRSGAVTLGVSDVVGAAPLVSPALTGTPTGPTAVNSDSSTALATTAFVKNQGYVTSTSAPVTSVAGRTGAVSLAVADVSGAAPLSSPALTGTPTAPTAAVNTNSTQVATTAFVLGQAANAAPLINGTGAIGNSTLFARQDHVHPTDTTRAPLTSPAFTGSPTAPTAATGTNTTQIATTAFVLGQAANTAPLVNGTTSVGTSQQYARQDHVHPTDTTRAPLASPVFTGTPTGPTPASPDNSTALATTAFVKSQGYVTSSTAPVTSVGGMTGAVNDLSGASAKSSGSNTSRTFAARFAERLNVLDYGADPTGTTDFSTAFQSLASSISGSATIYFPAGTYLFNNNTYVPDSVNVSLDAGVKFTGSGSLNANADGTVTAGKQANRSDMSVTSSDSNAWTTYTSLVIASTTGTSNYEKAAGYDATLSYDASSYIVGTGTDSANYTKDAVGRQMSASIVGTTLGRAWGSVSGATALSGADGLLIGHEIDLIAQVSQSEHNRKNSKTGSMVVSMGPGQPTTGYLVTSTNSQWYDGFTALKSSVSRYAFVLRDLSTYPSTVAFGVDASGNVSAQKITGAQNTLDDGAGNLAVHGVASLAGGLADASYVSQSPTNGFSISIPNGCSTLQLTPATALAVGTITMPSSPVNGQWLFISSTQNIASVTFNPSSGQTIVNSPSSLPNGLEITFQFQSSTARWICQAGNDQRINNSASSGSLIFGTGIDGNVIINSGTTTLSRDFHYSNLTISGSGSINTNGWRIFVSGTLDLSAAGAGAIQANGNNGNAAVSNVGGLASGGIAMRTVGVSPTTGGAGGNGNTTVGGVGAGGASNIFGNGGSGGSGGTGGASTNAGGSSGIGGTQSVQIPLNTPTVTFFTTGSNVGLAAGLLGGGGGGGGGDGTNSGGGGGSGGSFGGTIALFARVIQRGSNSNTSIVQAKGGAGGAGASATSGNAAGGGGGGGGGGGLIYVINETLLGNAISNALDVSGGSGGPGGAGVGTGKGGSGGGGGSSGSIQILNLLSPSYTTSAWNVSGASGGTTTTNSAGAVGAGAILKMAL